MSNKVIKLELIRRYGRYCMLCRRKLKTEECTYHHIKPKSVGGETDIENGAILCRQCQDIIHTFEYEETGYSKLTSKIHKNKRVSN